MNPTDLEAQLERLHDESYGWALACCRWDESEAEDVLQTAYVKVISGRARFGGHSSLKTWFFGVIRRSAQEHRRRARSREKGLARLARLRSEPPVSRPGTGELERSGDASRLVAALERLSRRQREVIHLVFYQDLSIAEAGRVMEVSLGSARTHYERAKSRLRALLREESPEEVQEGSPNV
jgi:RNA polymerase sigma-70 factor (ECF subfamily)